MFSGQKRIGVFVAAILLMPVVILPQLWAAGGQEASEQQKQDTAQNQWLEQAQLGPYSQQHQDWDAIEAAAREEGKVVILSVSSRIFKLQEDFKKQYGVEIEGYDMESNEQIEKFAREHEAGLYQTDVIYNNAVSNIVGKLLPEHLIWNFVPDDVAPLLDENEKEPFLVQRWSSLVFIYNTALNPQGPPVHNLWALTRSEWKGKVLVPPYTFPAMANTIQTIMNHPEQMAAAYEKEFGDSLELSADMKDAAQEWVYRFMKNAVTVTKTDKVFTGVADVRQQEAPLGLTSFSKLRGVESGVYEAAAIYDMEPVFGVSYPAVLLIADRAPHPNAAKLLIRYLMDKGFWPWNVLGDYASRSDVEAEQVKEFGVPPRSQAKLWEADAEQIFKTSYDYLQFMTVIQQ